MQSEGSSSPSQSGHVRSSAEGQILFAAIDRTMLVCILSSAITLEELHELYAFTLECASSEPKMSSIIVTLGNLSRPQLGAEYRAAYEKIDQLSYAFEGRAVVIEEGGFVGAALRSIITGMNALPRSRERLICVKSIEPAIDYVATKQPGILAHRATLLATLDAMRQRRLD